MEVVIKGLIPLSYNSRNKAVYQNLIRAAFLRKYRGAVPCFSTADELYARVYFFTSDGVNVDADNISKPIWDAVNGMVYIDDRKIVMRTAAVIDVKSHPFSTIDTSSMSGAVAADLIQNRCERQIRRLAKYRNNSFFTGSPEASKRLARLLSHFANCKDHHLDSFTYLCDVFRRINKTAKDELVNLLEHKWQPMPAMALA